MSKLTDTPNPIPASFLRGGTSKGIFLNRSTLPSDRSEWDRIFLGIMGSPDPEHGRQLNGMGGGVSSLSKICVVGSPFPSQVEEGIEVEYTFVQVGIRDSSIDYSGNCGNLSSMIGVFAVDEGICSPRRPGTHTTVRSFNTNTQKIIDTTFPISDASPPTPLLEVPETTIAGVAGKASTIILDFVNPGGARTGNLLPTGSARDHLIITLPDGLEKTVQCSCVDATNPTVFVSHADLSVFLPISDYVQGKSAAITQVSPILESIRQSAAIKMGLDPSAQAQPKIAILSPPQTDEDRSQGVDIVVNALSMGVRHKAVPMTVGLCVGVASNIQNTLAWEIVRGSRTNGENNEMVRIRHPSGIVDVGAEFSEDGSVKSAKVVRTGRRLMKGVVWW
ncbi:putative isomerase YraM [Hypsizygus marmoreus]|uniref:Isomerase YraM n=1 Tax=Hypsizygus marmoreus TaxID=39966 RepID=A0A369JPU9_HYPMA|nr:putative isomerase YraM [Hypsizygus marmoreus]